MRPELINSLILAYLGDAYFELLVREYLIREVNIAKPHEYQRHAIRFVSAKSQMAFMAKAIENGWLSEAEINMYKRGRNTKNGSKNETEAHRHSTGFEAIIGHLYLVENKTRIMEIFELYKEFYLSLEGQ